VRSLFVPLGRVQRDLGVTGEVNTILLGADVASASALATLTLEDLGVKVRYLEAARAAGVEAESGVLDEVLQQAATEVAARAGLRATPVFTYLANAIRGRGPGPGRRSGARGAGARGRGARGGKSRTPSSRRSISRSCPARRPAAIAPTASCSTNGPRAN
jgi:hypothetical protein